MEGWKDEIGSDQLVLHLNFRLTVLLSCHHCAHVLYLESYCWPLNQKKPGLLIVCRDLRPLANGVFRQHISFLFSFYIFGSYVHIKYKKQFLFYFISSCLIESIHIEILSFVLLLDYFLSQLADNDFCP